MEKITVSRTVFIDVSPDSDARKAGEAKRVKVELVFRDYSPEDFVDRLTASNSPRVMVQAALRRLAQIPDTFRYEVPKVGTRAAAGISPTQALESLVGAARAAAFITKFGSAEAAIEALRELMEA